LYLKWCNVDFNRNIIIVTQTKSKKNRNVPMNDLVIEALQGIERKSEYVFCDSKTGEPYHSIKTTYGKALKRAGLVGVRFHDLRHTAASMMVESGVDLATVKEILGHSRIEMTMRYAHPTSEGKMNAVKALEKQTKDLDGLNTGSTVKVVSMPKVLSDSNN
jgi:integrase